MTEEKKLDLMKKFKELNVAEYTTKYGDFYGLMFAGAEIVTKELQEELSKKADTNHAIVSQLANLEIKNAELKERNGELAGQKANLERWFGEAKGLLKRVIEWADWQSGSKCPSFKEIEKDIKEFLEE